MKHVNITHHLYNLQSLLDGYTSTSLERQQVCVGAGVCLRWWLMTCCQIFFRSKIQQPF